MSPISARAAKNFFQRGNLLALRELALRRTAERVDADVLAYRRQHGIQAAWPTAERILVAVGPSPGSERLIRATKRIAEGLHGDWIAAHVEVLGAPPLGDKDRERVENHLQLAESLGRRTWLRRLGRGGDARTAASTRHADRRRKPTHRVARPAAEPARYDDPGSGTFEITDRATRAAASRPAPVIAERASALSYIWAITAIAIVPPPRARCSPTRPWRTHECT